VHINGRGCGSRVEWSRSGRESLLTSLHVLVVLSCARFRLPPTIPAVLLLTLLTTIFLLLVQAAAPQTATTVATAI
jgi:hypothetical protein